MANPLNNETVPLEEWEVDVLKYMQTDISLETGIKQDHTSEKDCDVLNTILDKIADYEEINCLDNRELDLFCDINAISSSKDSATTHGISHENCDKIALDNSNICDQEENDQQTVDDNILNEWFEDILEEISNDLTPNPNSTTILSNFPEINTNELFSMTDGKYDNQSEEYNSLEVCDQQSQETKCSDTLRIMNNANTDSWNQNQTSDNQITANNEIYIKPSVEKNNPITCELEPKDSFEGQTIISATTSKKELPRLLNDIMKRLNDIKNQMNPADNKEPKTPIVKPNKLDDNSPCHKIIIITVKSNNERNNDDIEAIVRLIKYFGLEKQLDVQIKTEIFDYDYYITLSRTNEIWQQFRPYLVVHVGINDSEDIHIETLGREYGFSKPDGILICPALFEIDCREDYIIHSKINISEILKNATRGRYKIKESLSPGSTLNDFVYGISLSYDARKTISITFPQNNRNQRTLQRVLILKQIIIELYIERLEDELREPNHYAKKANIVEVEN